MPGTAGGTKQKGVVAIRKDPLQELTMAKGAAGIQVWDVALLRWSELRAYSAAHGIAWPFGSQASCLALFTQTWGENRMTKLNEMDGAGRDLMCSLPCFRRLVLNISVRPQWVYIEHLQIWVRPQRGYMEHLQIWVRPQCGYMEHLQI